MITGASDPATTEALARILTELNEMKLRNAQLESKVSCMQWRRRLSQSPAAETYVWPLALPGRPIAWCCYHWIPFLAPSQAVIFRS